MTMINFAILPLFPGYLRKSPLNIQIYNEFNSVNNRNNFRKRDYYRVFGINDFNMKRSLITKSREESILKKTM